MHSSVVVHNLIVVYRWEVSYMRWALLFGRLGKLLRLLVTPVEMKLRRERGDEHRQ